MLVDRILEEETLDLATGSEWNCRINVAEYAVEGVNDPQQLFLRYYADPFARLLWEADFPQAPLPPHEDPPYQRDRWLPKPR